ncbi:protein THEMIS2 isoform X1 [Lepisosteus oculatus]|uniref:Thymocyte selection associated family member 2 n=1 Tax=Lepisosteus oculatus TaxID=7918 RepID=W5M5F2_LEPOC|nr:PREDICTED: protein THEMIS2 isoform X1 [Lepisosteus oculatus]
MAGSSGEVLSLQEYIASVDASTLPRVLQVCSGVYFQGSVYELSGSEVCLSTGDLVKVIHTELLSVSCQDVKTQETFELPASHSGLFKLVQEQVSYSSIEEIVGLMPIGGENISPFTFATCHALALGKYTLHSGEMLTFLSEETCKGQPHARCLLQNQAGSPEVLIPFSCRGEFYQYVNNNQYSISQILASPQLRCRRFLPVKAMNWNGSSGGPLIFTPVHQVQAIMHLRKNVVKFPSNLEVDVTDVTEQSKDVTFILPLSLKEVSSQPDHAFPTVAEILEEPENQTFFKCHWMSALRKGQQLIVHGHQKSHMVLASSLTGKKAKQHFFISQSYAGRLRRRPREFATVYDLFVASSKLPGLRVNVSKHCESPEEDLPSLSVGEQLEVLFTKQMELNCDGEQQIIDVLVCNRFLDEDDEDEEEQVQEQYEQICLPMYLEGNFVEKLKDNKKYSLVDIYKSFCLPLDVKVAVRDPGLENDPLGGFSALKLEQTTVEPTVLASLPDRPDVCFELPSQWLNMSLYFTDNPLPWPKDQPPKLRRETVFEVTDNFYYEFHKLISSDMPPPPRPPKRKKSSKHSPASPFPPSSVQPKGKALPTLPLEDSLPPRMDKLTISPETQSDTSLQILDHTPPLLPRKPKQRNTKTQPNEYVMRPHKDKKKKVPASPSDSDHDYETVDDSMKAAQESILFY